jgi:creatinine amidohydrolase
VGWLISYFQPDMVAITQSAYPGSIKTAVVTPRVAPTGPIRDAFDYRARFPDGRIGSDPLLASVEKGAELIAKSAAAMIREFDEFTKEPFIAVNNHSEKP